MKTLTGTRTLKNCIKNVMQHRHIKYYKRQYTLYHTLFESHLTYGITVWGGVTNNKLLPLFKLQKKCLRILFGDKEAYIDKFKICARVRLFEEQKFGAY